MRLNETKAQELVLSTIHDVNRAMGKVRFILTIESNTIRVEDTIKSKSKTSTSYKEIWRWL